MGYLERSGSPTRRHRPNDHAAAADFVIQVPREDWARMGEDRRAALLKIFNEFEDSPRLVAPFDHLQAEGVARVVIRYDNVAYNPDGTVVSFGGEPGLHSYVGERGDTTGRDMRSGTFVISVNQSMNMSAQSFAKTVLHEFRHPVVSGMFPIDEDRVERGLGDYIQAATFVGSKHGDTAVGTPSNDTLAGLSGNDVLDGASGNDLVMGGSGMDRLTGGLGANSVEGGLDADTYVPSTGVTHEQVADIGGVDRL